MVLIWRLIIKKHGPEIEYIKDEKNMVVDAPSILALNGNQDTTQKFTYQKEIVSEINSFPVFPCRGSFIIFFFLNSTALSECWDIIFSCEYGIPLRIFLW